MATTCGVIRLRSARPRSHLSWPRPAPASGSTSTSGAMARPSSPMPAKWARRHRVEVQGFDVSLRPLAGLAQNGELGCTGCEARSRGRMGQKEMAIIPDGKNRIMIFGPKNDGTYVEFKTAAGEALAISIPRTEAVIRHFQERMPYGLFVPDVNAI